MAFCDIRGLGSIPVPLRRSLGAVPARVCSTNLPHQSQGSFTHSHTHSICGWSDSVINFSQIRSQADSSPVADSAPGWTCVSYNGVCVIHPRVFVNMVELASPGSNFPKIDKIDYFLDFCDFEVVILGFSHCKFVKIRVSSGGSKANLGFLANFC